MKIYPRLSKDQRQLVEEHLPVVQIAIFRAVIVNETVYGFSYEDLFQEGCLWLCKAALAYDPHRGVCFGAYATTVVTNGLLSYCRLLYSKQKRLVPLCLHTEDGDRPLPDGLILPDPTEKLVDEMDSYQLLHVLQQQYSGTVRKGLEALEWKAKGFTGADIAKMYGVKPNLIGAWISRTVRKLENNRLFIVWRDNVIFHTASNISKRGDLHI